MRATSDKPQITDHSVQAMGLQLYYRTIGNPQNPPLILLHGWGMRWEPIWPYRGMKYIATKFAEHFYVIAPELPGFQRSQTPRSPVRYEEYAKIIHALAQSLSIQKPILVGHSFGGRIASIYASLYPSELRYLVLVNAVLKYKAESDGLHPKRLHWMVKIYPLILSSPLIPTFLKKIIVSIAFGTPLKYVTEEEIQRKKNIENPLHFIFDTDFQFLQAPLLMIWGEHDLKMPVEWAKEVHKEVPNSTLIEIKGGHSIFSFKSKEVVRIITKQFQSTHAPS